MLIGSPWRFLKIAILSILVTGCGGGGGGGDGTGSTEKSAQAPIVFGSSAVEYYLNSEVQDNPLSGGSGVGEVSYSSSNEGVVAVDQSTGQIQLIAVGEATITARKEGDSDYRATTASYSVTVLEYLDQDELQFESAEVTLDLEEKTSFENPLTGGSGEGELLFVSSEESVAIVHPETGVVTPLNNGVTTIQVTKAGEGIYKAASAQYELTVLGPPDVVAVSIGLRDSQLTLNGQFKPIDIYRYTNQDCDIENYAVCSNGSLAVVADAGQLPVTDDYISVDLPAYVLLERAGVRSEPVKVSAERPPFVRRMGAAMISFKGKLFVIAGQDNSAGETGNETYWYNDIWSTVNGVNWVREVESAEFSPRAFHEVVEYNNSLYLIGGEEGVGTGGALHFKRDVWKSDDGVNWTKLVDLAPFLGQGQSIVFANKIWMVGDSSYSGESKIYSSTDGVNWDLELEVSPFGSRQEQGVYVWQNKLFIAGGMGEGGSDNLLADIWSSPDGRNWTQESADAGYGARVGMSVLALGDYLVMTGGHSFPDSHNTVYTSSDGVNWTLLTAQAIKQMNQTHSVTVHEEELWLYSGLNNDYMWSSPDGEIWRVPVEFSVSW